MGLLILQRCAIWLMRHDSVLWCPTFDIFRLWTNHKFASAKLANSNPEIQGETPGAIEESLQAVRHYCRRPRALPRCFGSPFVAAFFSAASFFNCFNVKREKVTSYWKDCASQSSIAAVSCIWRSISPRSQDLTVWSRDPVQRSGQTTEVLMTPALWPQSSTIRRPEKVSQIRISLSSAELMSQSLQVFKEITWPQCPCQESRWCNTPTAPGRLGVRPGKLPEVQHEMLPSSVPAKICQSSSAFLRQRHMDLTCPITTCRALEHARSVKLMNRTCPSQVDATNSWGERSTKSETGFLNPKSKMKRHAALPSVSTATRQIRILASMDAVARSGSSESSSLSERRSKVLRDRIAVMAPVCPSSSTSKAPSADHADTFPFTWPPYKTLGGGGVSIVRLLHHAAETGAVSLVRQVIDSMFATWPKRKPPWRVGFEVAKCKWYTVTTPSADTVITFCRVNSESCKGSRKAWMKSTVSAWSASLSFHGSHPFFLEGCFGFVSSAWPTFFNARLERLTFPWRWSSASAMIWTLERWPRTCTMKGRSTWDTTRAQYSYKWFQHVAIHNLQQTGKRTKNPKLNSGFCIETLARVEKALTVWQTLKREFTVSSVNAAPPMASTYGMARRMPHVMGSYNPGQLNPWVNSCDLTWFHIITSPNWT